LLSTCTACRETSVSTAVVGRGVSGNVVGVAVGTSVGAAVGLMVGVSDGSALGVSVGWAEGGAVGVSVGGAVGVSVGAGVGASGSYVGSAVVVKVGLTVLGAAVGVGVGAMVGPAVGLVDGALVGPAEGRAVGALVGFAVGLALGSGWPSTSVKADTILTEPYEVAHPPITVSEPDPAAGATSVAALFANLLFPVQRPLVNAPLDVSNTYSPLVVVRLTVSDSPGKYSSPDVRD
jgi:hypothetical protein